MLYYATTEVNINPMNEMISVSFSLMMLETQTQHSNCYLRKMINSSQLTQYSNLSLHVPLLTVFDWCFNKINFSNMCQKKSKYDWWCDIKLCQRSRAQSNWFWNFEMIQNFNYIQELIHQKTFYHPPDHFSPNWWKCSLILIWLSLFSPYISLGLQD